MSRHDPLPHPLSPATSPSSAIPPPPAASPRPPAAGWWLIVAAVLPLVLAGCNPLVPAKEVDTPTPIAAISPAAPPGGAIVGPGGSIATADPAMMQRRALPWLGQAASREDLDGTGNPAPPVFTPIAVAPPAPTPGEALPVPITPAPSPAPATAIPGAAPSGDPCAGIAVRSGGDLAIDGQPFVFFGVNAHYLLDEKFPEAAVEPLLQAMAEREINTVRVFYFHYHDPDRFERLLDAGRRQGIRFVVTMADNVFKGVDWFNGKEDNDKYRPHVERTVERFKDRPEILMWELINEPNCGEGRHDDDCLKIIRGWLDMTAKLVKARDACRVVSSGMIGDGNYENEQKSYRIIQRKDAFGVISVHRNAGSEPEGELELADDEDLPIFYGEVYDIAHEDGCAPLKGDDSPSARADNIKSDLRQAIDDGVDGYLLWDFAADGYCSKFGYEMDDPLWGKLQGSDDVAPPVPWR